MADSSIDTINGEAIWPMSAEPVELTVLSEDGLTGTHWLDGYQETMRQFLSMQERVMVAYLSGEEATQPSQRPGRPIDQCAQLPAPQQPAMTQSTPQPAPATPNFTQAVAIKAVPPVPALQRFVIEAIHETLDDVSLVPLGPAAYMVAGGDSALGREVVAQLAAAGATPVVLDAATCSNGERLAEAVAVARKKHGPIKALLYLVPYADPCVEVSAGLDTWRAHTHRNELGLYRLLQLLAGDLQQNGRVVAVSALGGDYGRGLLAGNAGLLAQGGQTGLLKSINDEWEAVRVKAVDLDPTLSAGVNAGHVLRELRLPGGRIETGYPAGQRCIFRTVPLQLPIEQAALRNPDSKWVVLATGGARGITAEVVLGLAQRGVRLLVIGRTPEPGAESLDLAALAGSAELRKYLLQKARSENRTPRPVDIEREVDQIRRDREIRSNLADFLAAGAQVNYRVCDVRNEQQVAHLLDDIYRDYGRLDAVVHGAGIIEDKLLVDKSMDSAARVFDTKVDSVYLLARYLRPATLQFVAFFTSVAGRYGNTGQADYAMANELVNRIATQLQQLWQGRVKVVAINWGPWEATRYGDGMVTPEAQRKFENMGVVLVPPAGGRELFMNEVLYGPPEQVEIIAGEAPWEQREQECGVIDVAHIPSGVGLPYPLIADASKSSGPRGEIVFSRTLDPAVDHYLTQHLLDNIPVLPAAAALELMAEAAACAWPDWVINEISSLRVLNGIRLDKGKLDLEVLVLASSHGDVTGFEASVTLREAGNPRPSYRATAHLGCEPLPAEIFQPPSIAPANIDVRHIYREWLFHGPLLQTMHAITGMEHRGALASLRPTTPAQWMRNRTFSDGWLFDPGLVDTGPQMALVWARIHRNAAALPSHFGAVRRYGGSLTGPCQMYFLMHRDLPEELIKADVAFVDDEGRLRLYIEAMECTASPALRRLGGGWKGEIHV